jgi:hypothetical protein
VREQQAQRRLHQRRLVGVAVVAVRAVGHPAREERKLGDEQRQVVLGQLVEPIFVLFFCVLFFLGGASLVFCVGPKVVCV